MITISVDCYDGANVVGIDTADSFNGILSCLTRTLAISHRFYCLIAIERFGTNISFPKEERVSSKSFKTHDGKNFIRVSPSPVPQAAPTSLST